MGAPHWGGAEHWSFMGKRRSRGRRDRDGFRPTRRMILQIAERDDSMFWIFGPRSPLRIFRCAICGRLRPSRELTVGHIVAQADGGSHDLQNLRLECGPCNFAEGATRNPAPIRFDATAVRARERKRAERRRRRAALERLPAPFENVPVFYNGSPLAYTSGERARYLVRNGTARPHEGGGVALTRPPQGTNPARNYFHNVCARCDAEKRLRRYWIYPRWHPRFEVEHLTPDVVRPVCVPCVDVFEICIGVMMTRVAIEKIESVHARVRHLRKLQDLGCRIWGIRHRSAEVDPETASQALAEFKIDPRAASIAELRSNYKRAQRLASRTAREAGAEIARRLIDDGFDFLGAFERVASGELNLDGLTAAGLPSFRTSLPGIGAGDLRARSAY